MVKKLINYLDETEIKRIKIIMMGFYPDIEYDINSIARVIYLKNCIVVYNPHTLKSKRYTIKKDGTRILMGDISVDETIKRYTSVKDIKTIFDG